MSYSGEATVTLVLFGLIDPLVFSEMDDVSLSLKRLRAQMSSHRRWSLTGTVEPINSVSITRIPGTSPRLPSSPPSTGTVLNFGA